MLAALLRIPPARNALQQQPAPPTSNWLSKPLPMEGRFNLLPIREQVPGMGPSVFNKRSLALPGVLAGAVNAFTAPGRAVSGAPGFKPQQEGADFAMNFMGGGLLGSKMAPPPRGSVGMNAFHGSPHKFDAFDISKIGTGEGAQAYGHGLYFAENPSVAKGYQTQLTGSPEIIVNGKSVGFARDRVGADAARMVMEHKGDVSAAIAKADRLGVEGKLYPYSSPRYLSELKGHIEQLKGAKIEAKPQGALYHVDIPDEAIGKMLDWDKPLSEQPAALEAFKKYGGPMTSAVIKDSKGRATVATYYAALSQDFGQQQASNILKEAGIPGIRYLDGGSRAGGQGTRNFVLFDDKLAKITKRE
jgi:hypothetical protein